MRPEPSAKWLSENGFTAPPAFFVPVDDAVLMFVRSVPDGASAEALVREWASRDFGARFMGLFERFLEDREIATVRRADLNRRIQQDQRLRDRLEVDLIHKITKPHIPAGVGWQCFICLSFLLCFAFFLEWWNLAGFAARSEMQDVVSALGYTFTIALLPIALEVAYLDKSLPRRIVSFLGILVIGFFFVHVYSDSYVQSSFNLSSEQLLGEVDGSVRFSVTPFWTDPLNTHWRLLWQWLLSVAVGTAFARWLVSQVSITTEITIKPNPARVSVEARLQALQRERDHWGERFAKAEGNVKEWQHSEAVHVMWRLACLDNETRRRQLVKAARESLKQFSDLALKEAGDADHFVRGHQYSKRN